jgi:hypothetical protein
MRECAANGPFNAAAGGWRSGGDAKCTKHALEMRSPSGRNAQWNCALVEGTARRPRRQLHRTLRAIAGSSNSSNTSVVAPREALLASRKCT